jgi:hypothetical protein
MGLENRVLGRIFVPKGKELTGNCRKLHSENIHSFCFSRAFIRIPKSRRMWGGAYIKQGITEKCVEHFNQKAWREGRMPKHKWEGNIKTVVKETGCENESRFIWRRIGLTGWACVNRVMNLQVL